MSQENVEVVKQAIAAVNERDVDAYLGLCAPDIELINPVAAIEGSNRANRGSGASSTALARRRPSSSWKWSACSRLTITAFSVG